MNKLGEKSLKTLEYYEILEKLAAQAASEAAKEKCRALRPLDDREQAELWMRQTTDAKERMVRQGSRLPTLTRERNRRGRRAVGDGRQHQHRASCAGGARGFHPHGHRRGQKVSARSDRG